MTLVGGKFEADLKIGLKITNEDILIWLHVLSLQAVGLCEMHDPKEMISSPLVC